MLSTSDIIALSFGIASTIIGIATAFITYIRRVSEVPDTERQATNGHLNITSPISTSTPPPVNLDLVTHDVRTPHSRHTEPAQVTESRRLSRMVHGGPPPYSNLPSPVTVTDVSTCTTETLPNYLHDNAVMFDAKSSLSTENKFDTTGFKVCLESPKIIHTQDIEE